MIYAIAAAYLILGALIAGWLQAEEAHEFAVVALLYPLLPIAQFAAWLREIVHTVRTRKQ